MPWKRRIIQAEGKALPRNKGMNTTISVQGIQETTVSVALLKHEADWAVAGEDGEMCECLKMVRHTD